MFVELLMFLHQFFKVLWVNLKQKVKLHFLSIDFSFKFVEKNFSSCFLQAEVYTKKMFSYIETNYTLTPK